MVFSLQRKAKEKRGRRKGGKQSRRFQEEEEEAEPMLNGFGDDEGDDASEVGAQVFFSNYVPLRLW